MRAPLLTAWAWRQFVSSRRLRRTRAALWCLCEVPGDDPIWTPFAPADIAEAAHAGTQVFRAAGVRAEDLVLAVAPGGPWVGNTLPYLLGATDSLLPGEVIGAEVFPLSVLTVAFRPDLTAFPLGRGPSVLLGPRAELRAVLEAAVLNGAAPPRARLALTYGAPGEPADPPLAPVEVELLYLPGALAPFGGAPAADGIWLPSERVRCEIIPDDEWARTIAFPHHAPRALPAAAAGLTGELVVTIPNHVHPLIRFRTQRRVTVRAAAADGVWVALRDGSRVRAAGSGSATTTPR